MVSYLDTLWVYSCRVVMTYTAIITFLLSIFCFYQVTQLAVNNVYSNEDIRGRWNGHRRN